jgi:hypothetical protein
LKEVRRKKPDNPDEAPVEVDPKDAKKGGNVDPKKGAQLEEITDNRPR